MSGALSVVEVFEELGASEDAESCVDFIREIEEAMACQSTWDSEPGLNGELLEKTLSPTPANCLFT